MFHILTIIRKDKAFKIVITSLSFSSFVVTTCFPSMVVHSATISLITNLIWLWEL